MPDNKPGKVDAFALEEADIDTVKSNAQCAPSSDVRPELPIIILAFAASCNLRL